MVIVCSGKKHSFYALVFHKYSIKKLMVSIISDTNKVLIISYTHSAVISVHV